MTTGEKIRAQRLKIGMSADELAEKIGKNRATVYRYESDEIEKLPVSILGPLAKALGCSPSYLAGIEDDVNGTRDAKFNKQKLEFGKRLKWARMEKGYDGIKLADKIGLSISALYDIEVGRSLPSMRTFYQILDALEVDPNFLLQYDDDTSQISLDNSEKYIIERFRSFNDLGKNKTLEYIKDLEINSNYKAQSQEADIEPTENVGNDQKYVYGEVAAFGGAKQFITKHPAEKNYEINKKLDKLIAKQKKEKGEDEE